MTMSCKSKAAFIDRDGVINEERNYVHRIEEFVILPGVVRGLALLRKLNFKLIVVTNQAGIAHGFYQLSDLDLLHKYLHENLAQQGVTLDAIYFCPHHPRGLIQEFAIECDCRKPQPGMLLKAANDFQIDMSKSVMIGDKTSDLQAGKSAGVGSTIIVESGHALDLASRQEADEVSKDLFEAASLLSRR